MKAADSVVYTAWDADDWCLYVGCTSALAARMSSHARRSPWHPFMARLDVSEPLPYPTARDLERRTVADLKPQFNVNHNGFLVNSALFELDMRACEAMDAGAWRSAADAFACKDAVGAYGCGATPVTDEVGYRDFVRRHVNPSTARAYGLAAAA